MGGKIIFWNCALGIKSKLDFVKDLATTQRPDLMFISEAEVNDCDLSLINIKGYEISVSESINGEFGVARMACYIKMGIKAKKIRVDNRLDVVAVDVGNNRFIGIYKGFKRPGSLSRREFFNLLLKHLTKPQVLTKI